MIIIREAAPGDARGKGLVHYQSFQESYAGLVSQHYLDQLTPDACVDLAIQIGMDHTFVAVNNDHAVGFYHHLGFVPDGASKKVRMGEDALAIRMIRKNPPVSFL